MVVSSGASTMFTKSKRPSVAHCALTVAPSCSISLFTSRIRDGLFLIVWTPSGVRVLSRMKVGIGAPLGEGRTGWVLAVFPLRRKRSRLAAVLGRLYDATWGRAFAWGYDTFQRRSCAAGMEDKRRQVLGEARGHTLEIGSGTGINLDHYGPEVTELGLSE